MSKEEFLTQLSQALRGELGNETAYGHVSYYSDYIDKEVKKGKSEAEVIEQLGNPRLIARSIIDSERKGRSSSQYETYEDGSGVGDTSVSGGFFINGKPINPIIAIVAAIVIAALVLSIVFWVIKGVAWILFKVVLPIVLVLIIIGFIMKLIDKLRE